MERRLILLFPFHVRKHMHTSLSFLKTITTLTMLICAPLRQRRWRQRRRRVDGGLSGEKTGVRVRRHSESFFLEHLYAGCGGAASDSGISYSDRVRFVAYPCTHLNVRSYVQVLYLVHQSSFHVARATFYANRTLISSTTTIDTCSLHLSRRSNGTLPFPKFYCNYCSYIYCSFNLSILPLIYLLPSF